MATDFLVKQGKVMGGVRLVTDADVAHQTDLTNIRETGTTSSQAISAGTYFYLNDTLVRAKVAIANGATFTLNTNYEVVTAGALNELKDKFNYSTSEHVVGKWIDGKTLYEKTIPMGGVPNSGNLAVAHGITNLLKIVDIKGVAIRTSPFQAIPLPHATNPATNNIQLYADATNVNMSAYADLSVFSDCYITIRYIKTS